MLSVLLINTESFFLKSFQYHALLPYCNLFIITVLDIGHFLQSKYRLSVFRSQNAGLMDPQFLFRFTLSPGQSVCKSLQMSVTPCNHCYHLECSACPTNFQGTHQMPFFMYNLKITFCFSLKYDETPKVSIGVILGWQVKITSNEDRPLKNLGCLNFSATAVNVRLGKGRSPGRQTSFTFLAPRPL